MYEFSHCTRHSCPIFPFVSVIYINYFIRNQVRKGLGGMMVDPEHTVDRMIKQVLACSQLTIVNNHSC